MLGIKFTFLYGHFFFQSGIGGCLFFVLGIVLDILLFPILSVELKTKAPGAKTFLQVKLTMTRRSCPSFDYVVHVY